MAGDGAAVGFDAAAFRTAIRGAMVMGSPGDTIDKATFRWDRAQTFARHDPAGRPYHWADTAATDTTHADVVLDEVAVEYTPARVITGTAAGEFVPIKAQLTLLDVDHDLVVGANLVLLHQAVWAIVAETEVALFSVNVYTLYIERQ